MWTKYTFQIQNREIVVGCSRKPETLLLVLAIGVGPGT